MPLFIDGVDVHGEQYRDKLSPIDRDWVLGSFAQATAADADRAMQAAKDAFAQWRATPLAERLRLLRRVAQLIEERVYHIGAALTLEVGKNRMEALGETQETADFFSVYCDDFEQQQGFDRDAAQRSAAEHGLAQSQRDETLRRVGGDHAVQFPVCAGRRPRCGGTRDWQHRRAERCQ